MLTAEDRVILVRAKIERAKRQFQEFIAELAIFEGRHQMVSAGVVDSHTRQINPPFTNHDLPILSFNALTTAGDIIHNLRSALDHLAYQLVLVGSPGIQPSRRVEFPIAKDLAAYEADKLKKVEGMRSDAIAAIDRLKPYRGGNEALWRIHELNNADKHRVLLTVGKDWLIEADWVPGGYPYWLKTSDPHFSGIYEADLEKDIRLTSETLGDPNIIKGNKLLPVFRELVFYVEELVRHDFVAYLE